IRKRMRHIAKSQAKPVPLALEDTLGDFELRHLLAAIGFDGKTLAELLPGRDDRPVFQTLLILIFLNDLMNHVHDPGPDRLHQDLRAFLLEEGEHVEVTVALRGLRPELAGDLDDGLHARAVDLDLVETATDLLEGLYVLVAQELREELADVLGGRGRLRQRTKNLGETA